MNSFKKKPFLILMAAVFTVLMALVLFVDCLPSVFSSVMAFPFEQLGAALRSLALTGNLGNGLAVALAIAISMFPVIAALRMKHERTYLGERIVLCCMGVAVFVTLYFMANPTALLSAFPHLPPQSLSIEKGIMGAAVWSFLVLWVILRLVRLFQTGDTDQLLRYLRVALQALCLIFTAAIALSCGSSLLDNLTAEQPILDKAITVVGFVVSALPYLFDIGITLTLLTLFDAYTEKNDEETARQAALLSRRCCFALVVTASSTTGLNIAQLVLSRFLYNVSVNVIVPVVSLAFILLVLILSRLAVENRKLQSDNDLFI